MPHDVEYDPKLYQGCYIYTPPSEQPSKRRKTARADPPPEPPQKPLFPKLLNGEEDDEHVQLRWDTFNTLWSAQQSRIDEILSSFNETTLSSVASFVRTAEPDSHGKIPTVLVLTGPNIAAHGPLYQQLAERIQDQEQLGRVVILASKDAPNLKSALRKLIHDATSIASHGVGEAEDEVDDDEQEAISGRRGAKRLNYDLQILANWCKLHEGQKIVVAIQDTDAFEVGILADLVDLFAAYLDRIPFVLLMNVATSVEIFHERLPKSTLRKMRGEQFGSALAEELVDRVFEETVAANENVLKLGPGVCEFLAGLRAGSMSVQSFTAALKFAYMSHFYANSLSFLISPSFDTSSLTPTHLAAIRNLPSFRLLVELLTEDSSIDAVRDLVVSPDPVHIHAAVTVGISRCKEYCSNLSSALKIVETSRTYLVSSGKTTTPKYMTYASAISGDLNVKHASIRSMLLEIKKMSSATLTRLLASLLDLSLPEDLITTLSHTQKQLSHLTTSAPRELTTSFSAESTTPALRSTAVSRRIMLGNALASLSDADKSYSTLVTTVVDALRDFLESALTPVRDEFLHELFFYDLVPPHRDCFSAKQKNAVERAMIRPAEYLGCECCEGGEEDAKKGWGGMKGVSSKATDYARYIDDSANLDPEVKASMPPAAIVWKLIEEAGLLVNTFDLWRAFWAVVGESEEEDKEGEGRDGGNGEGKEGMDEKVAMAAFFRAVAELGWVGAVKTTKRRVDHLQRTAWRGL